MESGIAYKTDSTVKDSALRFDNPSIEVFSLSVRLNCLARIRITNYRFLNGTFMLSNPRMQDSFCHDCEPDEIPAATGQAVWRTETGAVTNGPKGAASKDTPRI